MNLKYFNTYRPFLSTQVFDFSFLNSQNSYFRTDRHGINKTRRCLCHLNETRNRY